MPVIPDKLEDYPSRTTDKLRYGDCDPVGHVNNAAFSTFLETGRTEFLYANKADLPAKGCDFVIARLELDFLGEINWPGTVDIGTAVLKVGNSSITMAQALFHNGKPVARALTVIVQIDRQTRKGSRFSEQARERLAELTLRTADA